MGERMTPARVLAAAGLALVFLTSASVALAAGRVALVVARGRPAWGQPWIRPGRVRPRL